MAGNKRTHVGFNNRTTSNSGASNAKNKQGKNGAPSAVAIGQRLGSGAGFFGQSSSAKNWTVTNTEYSCDIIGYANVTPVPIALSLNPTNYNTFPWLSRVAAGFEMYRYKSLKIIYSPSCSSSTSGLMVGAFEYDALDAQPSTKQQISAMEGSNRVNVWNRGEFNLSPPDGWFYTAPTGVSVGDARLTDVARFFYGVFGATQNGTVGEFTIKYTIEFSKPEMSNFAANDYVQFTNSSLTNMAGTEVVAGDQIFTGSNGGNGVLNMAFTSSGQFLINSVMNASSATAPSQPPVSVVQLRGGVTIPANPVVDYINNFQSSSSSYGVFVTMVVNVTAGDVLVLTANAVFSALSYARMRLSGYRVSNG